MRSAMVSADDWLAPTTRSRAPGRMRRICSTASTSVRVLPVPGGPLMRKGVR